MHGLHDDAPRLSRRTFLAAASALGIGALMSGGHVAHASAPGGDGILTDTMADPKAWDRFLAGLDLRWGTIPQTFYEGPFLGNGGLGTSVYQVADRLSFTLGDSRVRDHQGLNSSTFGNARLPIGRMELVTAGEVTDVDLRLSLFHAELRGTVTTTAGTVELVAFVDSVRDVLAVSTTPSGGEEVGWSFVPYPARSTRFDFRTDDLPDGLQENPPPEVGPDRSVQRLAVGGGTTTLWRQDGGDLLLTVAHSFPEDTATADAEKTLADAPGVDGLTAEHREWWNTYYTRSFVSVPDPRLQSFYWIQHYKMASATREDRPPVGTAAIWLEPTPWPATWWNLNVQLEYWMINATAHYELDSLTRSIDTYRDNLVLNVPEQFRGDSSGISRTSQEDLRTLELLPAGDPADAGSRLEIANLTWAMHNVWLRYRHTMDSALLRDVLFPVLRRSVNYMLHFVEERADGRWHMPRTYSPEYDFADDCNYTLSVLSWGCRTLLWCAERLGVDDPLVPRWRDVADRMVTPPQGPDGLWIGADRQLDSSHRHYSHIMWFYPLYLLDPGVPENRDLLERSLAHWVSFEGALQGYTFTGAASMSAMLGKGDDALDYLNTLLDRFVQPNTMYAETGPVIETPLSGAQTIHDMLLTSWGDRIRVFPGVPAAWQDISFHRLRTEGAFDVSAARRGGATEWVHVTSLAGEPCRIQPGGLPEPWSAVSAQDGSPVPSTVEDGALVLELAKDQSVLLVTEGTRPDAVVEPVGAAPFGWGKPDGLRGRSVPVELAGVFTHDAISPEDAQGDGDLGNGYTFPAEELPEPGPVRLNDVDWTFPDGRGPGVLNSLVPADQRVDVPRGRYARINVLGTTVPSVRPDGEFNSSAPSVTPVTATYADGTTTVVEIALSPWDKQASQRDLVARQVTHRHSVTRPDLPPINQSARIFHQTAEIDAGRELVSLTFGPNANAATTFAHLFAVSVEEPAG